jgi:S-formylglutathione hydrolase FrmB
MVLLVGLPLQYASAAAWRKDSADLAVLNLHIKGKVVDHTANHGHDNRMYSRLLRQRRDVYVYVPPAYDPCQRYPVVYFLHGFGQDERVFLELAPLFDEAIACGKLPPVIVVCPDGTVNGEGGHHDTGSFFLNTRLGDFEDYVLNDVWDFVCRHYSIRSERQAHVLAGVSMGGFAAFNFGIRHRDAFGVVVGVFPLLNLRWMDDQDNYMADFDPRHWGWRQSLGRHGEVMSRHGIGLLSAARLFQPLFGTGDEAIWELSRENPIEMVDRCCLRNGELSMYIAYGGRDEYNIDAQVESFLYLAKYRRIAVAVGYDPDGRHNLLTAHRLWPGIISWLAPQLAPYSPPAGQVHQAGHHDVQRPPEPHPAPPSACPDGSCPGTTLHSNAHVPAAAGVFPYPFTGTLPPTATPPTFLPDRLP